MYNFIGQHLMNLLTFIIFTNLYDTESISWFHEKGRNGRSQTSLWFGASNSEYYCADIENKMFRFLFVHDSQKWSRIYVTKSRVVFYFTRERDAKNRFHGVQPDGATRTLPRAISWTITKTYFCLNPQLSRINLYVGIPLWI